MIAIAEEQRENNGKRPGGVTGKGFMPGRSGNPRGRPPGRGLTAIVREAMDRPVPDGKTVADLVAEVIVARALAGDFRFCKMLLDRLDGKVTARAEIPPGTDW